MDENMVDEQLESVQDDTAQASTAEQEQNGVVALSELLGKVAEESSETEETQDTTVEQPVQQEEKVNNGIKGRLLAENKKGFEAGRAAALKEWEAKEAEYQAKLAKLEQIELRERATQIAKEQNVSEAIAMFLAKNGFGSDSTTTEQPKPAVNTPNRDEKTGRFVSNKVQESNTTPSADERASVLYEQAKNIERMTGVKALDLFQSADSVTQGKIARGEMDLFDLVRESNNGDTKRTPPNIRTNTSRSAGTMQFGKLSDDDIDKLNDYLRRGGVVNGDL